MLNEITNKLFQFSDSDADADNFFLANYREMLMYNNNIED